jgi:hypothetical protein
MSKSAFEQAADIVIAMVQAGMIKPDFGGERATTESYAKDVADAYRTVFAATSDPGE